MTAKTKILEQMRQDARDIFFQGLAAADPETCIRNLCSITGHILTVGKKAYDLDEFTAIWVLGAGKAGASMAFAIESILKDRITKGFVIVKSGHVRPLHYITLAEAGHPVPDERGSSGQGRPSGHPHLSCTVRRGGGQPGYHCLRTGRG